MTCCVKKSPRGVRVIVVEPGAVDTPLREHITDPEARATLDRRLEKLRPLDPEDVANAVVFALSQPEHVAFNEILVRPTQQAW